MKDMLRGVCDICGKPDELHVCVKCGKRVCKEHYHNGLCSDCYKEEKPLHGRNELVIPDSAKPTTVTPGVVKK